MATGGEVQGQCPGSVGSEDLDQRKCQPCLEDGNLREVVGMCIDCQGYLCAQCFKVHTVAKPMRNHQLLDKEQMLQSQIPTSPKDVCTEKCSVLTITSAKHDYDLKVKTQKGHKCWITGLVVLPDGRLVLADHTSGNIMTLNVQSGQVMVELELKSYPWDVAAINNNKVAVTLPHEKKIAIVIVGDSNLSIENYLNVSGKCNGVDYRNGKLAVSFTSPDKVQVLNMKGTVLYTISEIYEPEGLFYSPHYLTFGQDDTTLYVSNYNGNDVVCLKLNGTVVAKYEDNDLKYPLQPIVDNNGNVYVCTLGSNQVQQISKDCEKIKVLLTLDDGIDQPHSICLSEEEDKLYVGMEGNNNVSVYKLERRPQ